MILFWALRLVLLIEAELVLRALDQQCAGGAGSCREYFVHKPHVEVASH